MCGSLLASGSGQQCEDCEGSLATWYRGRTLALSQLGEDKLGAGHRFVLKSRQKHSAYKECYDCQTKRLAIAKAIADCLPLAEIQRAQKDFADHIQWFMKQRHVLCVPIAP